MKSKTTGNKMPTANLAINKSRIKKYGKNNSIPSYYLEKGQEFQIELFNPTQDKILTTIKLNNKAISGGLVLRPGERVFLDRFLDTNKKFLFDTYTVDNTKSAKKAIEPNGDVEIAFFKEVVIPQIIFTNGGSGTVTLDWMNNTGNYTGNLGTVTNFTTDLASTNTNFLNVSSGVDFSYNQLDNQASITRSFMGSELSTESDKQEIKKTKSLRNRISKSPTKIETGRVEKGSTSKQDLREATGEFEMFSFHVVKYKLTPKSEQKLTSVDYYSKYCTSCGGRCKTKFCPFCGAKQ